MAAAEEKLKVFLRIAGENQPLAIELHDRLFKAGCSPWLESKEVFPGMDWKMEISKALLNCDVAIFCLSSISINKEGYFQKEIRIAKSIQDEKPQGTIYLIPIRLDACDIPQQLSEFAWGDYSQPDGFNNLLRSLNIRANELRKTSVQFESNGHPDKDTDLFENITNLATTLTGEFPSNRYFEFGDDPKILDRVEHLLEELNHSMNRIRNLYDSSHLLKESNPFFDVLMNIHKFQDFVLGVRKKEGGSKENTIQARTLLANLNASIRVVSTRKNSD